MKPGTGRMLDRTGQPLAVPVTVGERVDGQQRWITADLALAPLAPGDYAVEIRTVGATGEDRRHHRPAGRPITVSCCSVRGFRRGTSNRRLGNGTSNREPVNRTFEPTNPPTVRTLEPCEP